MAVGFDKPLAIVVSEKLVGSVAAAADEANTVTMAQNKTRRILFMKFSAAQNGKLVNMPGS